MFNTCENSVHDRTGAAPSTPLRRGAATTTSRPAFRATLSARAHTHPSFAYLARLAPVFADKLYLSRGDSLLCTEAVFACVRRTNAAVAGLRLPSCAHRLRSITVTAPVLVAHAAVKSALVSNFTT